MDCNLPGFAKQLPKYYMLNDSLPKHYKEALILYRHRYSNPAVVYDNAVTNADYQDFQKLSASLPDQKSARSNWQIHTETLTGIITNITLKEKDDSRYYHI